MTHYSILAAIDVGVEIATIKPVSALFESRNGHWFILNNATQPHLFRGEHLKRAPRCRYGGTEVAAFPARVAGERRAHRNVLGIELSYLIFKILLIC
jgi:hypothetical protein